MILIAGGWNLFYQFWVHTETVDRLPAWVESWLNTPSHHRVHHGANPQYLDKNYAGVLIVWDRLFGTFEPEGERVVYGLTKNIESYNLLWVQLHEYPASDRPRRRPRASACASACGSCCVAGNDQRRRRGRCRSQGALWPPSRPALRAASGAVLAPLRPR
jgi:hypothetical protein